MVITQDELVSFVQQIDALREENGRLTAQLKRATNAESEWRRNVALVQQSLVEERRLCAEWQEQASGALWKVGALRAKLRRLSKKGAR